MERLIVGSRFAVVARRVAPRIESAQTRGGRHHLRKALNAPTVVWRTTTTPIRSISDWHRVMIRAHVAVYAAVYRRLVPPFVRALEIARRVAPPRAILRHGALMVYNRAALPAHKQLVGADRAHVLVQRH